MDPGPPLLGRESRGASSSITVVVPARNADSTLGDCLDALRGQTLLPAQIMVVDDASTDRTVEVARASGAEVLALPDQGGPGPARAAGVAAARGEIVVFTDADCVAEPTFLERLVEPLANGAVAAKGAYTTRQRGLIPRFIQLEFEARYRRLRQHTSSDFVDGHAVAYRKSVLEAVGGVDPGLRLSQNVEVGYRLAELGLPIRFVPAARTRHSHPSTALAYAEAKFQRAYWRTRSYGAHPGKALADSYTPPTLKLQAALAVLFMAALGLAAAKAVGDVPGLSTSALRRGLALLAVGFAASAAPFTVRALGEDPAVGLVALPLLVLRAAAVGAGAVVGLVSLAAQPVRRRPDVGAVSAARGIGEAPAGDGPAGDPSAAEDDEGKRRPSERQVEPPAGEPREPASP